MCDTGLRYPGFSIVFIQTFSIHYTRMFQMPQDVPEALKEEGPFWDESSGRFIERADHLGVPIARTTRKVEEQIFILHPEKKEEIRNVRRFSLRGFDFTMPLYEEVPCTDEKGRPLKDKNGREKTEPREKMRMEGHCNVEMSLFFGHIASLTYRFFFDGSTARISQSATTDDLISLLSIWLSAEYWNRSKDESNTADINMRSRFIVHDLHFTQEGDYSPEGEKIDMYESGRFFDKVALRYKKFLYHCTLFTPQATRKEKNSFRPPTTVENDSHYAMVDIWESIAHPDENGEDLFDKRRRKPLSEAEIIDHIHSEHKSELVGLMTLYPKEWIYRDPDSYDEVCGENIAIDTDDLVLCGSSMCVVLGTYGRRGADTPGINWQEIIKERKREHVSWQEYLVVLQMVLARKQVISHVTDRLVESTSDMTSKSPSRLIQDNAQLSIRLSRMLLQLDVVKMSKFPSHKVMFDRTTRRLGLEEDMARLDDIMDKLDGSLHNISEAKSAKSENFLNIVLGLISIASAFQLFFQDPTMPFLRTLGLEDMPLFSAIIIAGVAALSIFAILYLLVHFLRDILLNNKLIK